MEKTRNRTILIVEDDPRLSRSLCEQLETASFSALPVFDGTMARRAIRHGNFELVILDLSLPGVDGFNLLEEFRRKDRNTPVIVLTAFGDLDSKLNAFKLGADDYLVKPIHFQELLAKVKVFLKRADSNPLAVEHIQVADLHIDLARKKVTRGGKLIDLTPKEFILLACLARNRGRVLSKDDLAEQVWDNAYGVSSNTIEVYISFLRSKVDKGHAQPLIHTKHGFGYTVDEPLA